MNKFLYFSSRTGNKFFIDPESVAAINYIKEDDKIIVYFKNGGQTELDLGVDFEKRDLVQLYKLADVNIDVVNEAKENVKKEAKKEAEKEDAPFSQEDLSEVTALLNTLTGSLGDVMKNLNKTANK